MMSCVSAETCTTYCVMSDPFFGIRSSIDRVGGYGSRRVRCSACFVLDRMGFPGPRPDLVIDGQTRVTGKVLTVR